MAVTKNVPLTQEELKYIVGIVNNLEIKIGDARVLLPLVEKLLPFIDQPKELSVEELKKEGQKTN